MKKIARIVGFRQIAEMDFQLLSEARKVTMDFKYGVVIVNVFV